MAASPSPAGGGGAGAAHGSGPSSFAFDSGLEIKTRSVEQTLLPLVSQVKRRARPLILPPRPRPAMAAVAPGGGRAGPGGRQPLPHIPCRDCGVGVWLPFWGLRTGLR